MPAMSHDVSEAPQTDILGEPEIGRWVMSAFSSKVAPALGWKAARTIDGVLAAFRLCISRYVLWRPRLPSHPRKGHAFPYFKVQFRDLRTLAWKDHRKEAFSDEASARAYRASLSADVQTRIMRWDEAGAEPLQD